MEGEDQLQRCPLPEIDPGPLKSDAGACTASLSLKPFSQSGPIIVHS